mmetsp:Transcript_13307/g.34004  ORF Transcript_13307/g.34004 Transcript_13307/m.34004 type:complete len:226 (+) Transcript_13307:889-1566(+)
MTVGTLVVAGVGAAHGVHSDAVRRDCLGREVAFERAEVALRPGVADGHGRKRGVEHGGVEPKVGAVVVVQVEQQHRDALAVAQRLHPQFRAGRRRRRRWPRRIVRADSDTRVVRLAGGDDTLRGDVPQTVRLPGLLGAIKDLNDRPTMPGVEALPVHVRSDGAVGPELEERVGAVAAARRSGSVWHDVEGGTKGRRDGGVGTAGHLHQPTARGTLYVHRGAQGRR